MADIVFRIFRVSDRELVDNLIKIADRCNAPQNSTIVFHIAPAHSNPMRVTIDEIKTNEDISQMISTNASIYHQIEMTITQPKVTVRVVREDVTDKAYINIPKEADAQTVMPLISTSYEYLHSYNLSDSIDKVLGDELAEFYRRREQGLVHLEELTENLIKQNVEYRKTLDNGNEELKSKLQSEYDAKETQLDDEYTKKNKNLEEREAQLEEQKQVLHDQSSRHERRQIRLDMKDKLAEQSKKFTLTEDTNKKRNPIHFLFSLLIGATITFFISYLLPLINDPTILNDWFVTLRLSLSIAALAAAIIYYIRWNDQWFRQHADEEFKLKQLEFDIDRAGWVFEMALDWKDEKDTEFPEELMERLSRNLFVGKHETIPVKHPNEDLASTLLDASSGLTLKIPGFGDVNLSRRNLKKFIKKAADDTSTDAK